MELRKCRTNNPQRKSNTSQKITLMDGLNDKSASSPRGSAKSSVASYKRLVRCFVVSGNYLSKFLLDPL